MSLIEFLNVASGMWLISMVEKLNILSLLLKTSYIGLRQLITDYYRELAIIPREVPFCGHIYLNY